MAIFVWRSDAYPGGARPLPGVPEEHFDHDDPRARCSSLVEGG